MTPDVGSYWATGWGVGPKVQVTESLSAVRTRSMESFVRPEDSPDELFLLAHEDHGPLSPLGLQGLGI